MKIVVCVWNFKSSICVLKVLQLLVVWKWKYFYFNLFVCVLDVSKHYKSERKFKSITSTTTTTNIVASDSWIILKHCYLY